MVATRQLAIMEAVMNPAQILEQRGFEKHVWVNQDTRRPYPLAPITTVRHLQGLCITAKTRCH